MDGVAQRVHIGDQEADIYELFASERQPGADLLIRATHNRSLEDGGRLWDQMAASRPGCLAWIFKKPPAGLPVRGRSKYAGSWYDCNLLRGNNSWVLLNCMHFGHRTLPTDRGNTAVLEVVGQPVVSYQQALQAVQWYSLRWLIERFHFVLKSGCGVEELQLRSLAGLQNALACYSLVAYRLMWLVYESRANPEGRCDQILHEQEWRALCSYHHKSFAEAEGIPTLGQAVLWIAILGGFLNRKSDGLPGIKNLWGGMRRLQELTDMWIAFENGTYQQADSFG